jgi:type III secretory pathway component EscV
MMSYVNQKNRYLDEAEWNLNRLENALRDVRTQTQKDNENNQLLSSLEVRRYARKLIEKLQMFDFCIQENRRKQTVKK